MKHCIGWLGVLLVLLGTGCDTVNHTQYQLNGPPTAGGARTSVSAADSGQVREVLSAIAAKLRFEDRTAVSLKPKTIGLFVQQETREPVRIVAWEQDGRIAVEVTHAPSAPGESEYYRKVQDMVFTELQTRFGGRVAVPAWKNSPSSQR